MNSSSDKDARSHHKWIKERLLTISEQVVAGILIIVIGALFSLITYYWQRDIRFPEHIITALLSNRLLMILLVVGMFGIVILVAWLFIRWRVRKQRTTQKIIAQVSPTLDKSILWKATKVQFAREMLALQDKYIPELYVPRMYIEDEFKEFLRHNERNCFLVVGEAGTGKTNQLCYLASERIEQFPALFYRAATLSPERFTIEHAVMEDLSFYTGLHFDINVFSAIDDGLTPEGDTLLVFIDAINECSNISVLSEALGNTLENTKSYHIKYCISCRSADWRFFQDNARIINNLYALRASLQEAQEGVLLPRFSEAELSQAWEKYRSSARFTIKGGLSEEARSVCSHPIMLRFVCEAYKGHSIPELIKTKQVFDEYWQKKVANKGKHKVTVALYDLVAYLHSIKSVTLTEEQVIRLLSEEAYNILLSENIILYTKIDRITGLKITGFTYETFLEYVLASQIIKYNMWSEKTENEVIKLFGHIMEEAESYRTLVGVVEFIVLTYAGTHLMIEMLRILSRSDSKWKMLVCTLIPKLEETSPPIYDILKLLSADPEYWVRWTSAYALSQIFLKSDNTRILEEWAASPVWQTREAAANAMAHIEPTVEVLMVLKMLASDNHWRVRRAVSYSLNRQFTHKQLSLEVAREWSHHAVWKVRDAIVSSQLDLSVDPNTSISIFEFLAEDSNEQVRWSVAKYAVTIPTTDRSLKILDKLSSDSSYWIRKRVVTSLAEFVTKAPYFTLVMLDRLSVDTDKEVQWEVARTLGKFHLQPDKEQREMLQRLLKNTNSNIRAAAQYSTLVLDDKITKSFPEVLQQIQNSELVLVREAVARIKGIIKQPEIDSPIYKSWKVDHYLNFSIAIQIAAEQIASNDKQIFPLLSVLAEDAEEGIRWAIAQIISLLPLLQEEREQLLFKLLSDRQVWVRRSAVEAIGTSNLATPSVFIPRLIELASDRAAEVRIAVAEAVKALGLQSSVAGSKILEQLKSDEDLDVRRTAI